ncbi:MAG: hypothetical protein LRY50_09640 [Geovibrio sp.]|nr:hypothetical protein [Geovibrio sp.]
MPLPLKRAGSIKNIELTDDKGRKTVLLQFGSPIEDSRLTDVDEKRG